MKQLPLTNGGFAIVDDEDYEELSKYRWHSAGGGYAWRMRPKKAGEKWDRRIGLHRHVMNLDEDDDRVVDHIDRNPLNNQKANLRICTEAENALNRSMLSSNKSGYKGVSWAKHLGKWRAQISFNRKIYSAGVHETAEAAYEAYCLKALELHREFANTEIKEFAELLEGREPHTPHRNKTGFKGVQYNAETKKWRAKIMRGGKGIYLGFFTTPELAHEAYLKAVRELSSAKEENTEGAELMKAA